MSISIKEIEEKLKLGNYKIFNKNTGVTCLCNRPSSIKYCYKSGDYEVYEPDQKTNIKANKK